MFFYRDRTVFRLIVSREDDEDDEELDGEPVDDDDDDDDEEEEDDEPSNDDNTSANVTGSNAGLMANVSMSSSVVPMTATTPSSGSTFTSRVANRSRSSLTSLKMP